MDENQTNSFIPMEMGKDKTSSVEPAKNDPAVEGAEEQVHFGQEAEPVSNEPVLKEEGSKEQEEVSKQEEEPTEEPNEELKEEPKEEPIGETDEEPKGEPEEDLKEELKEEPAPVEYPKERMILSPATVSSKNDVDLPEVKVSNHPNIIKNIVVVVVALLLVGGIAGAVGYFLGKGGD